VNNSAILLPLMALVGWTFIVLLNIPLRRFRAGARREVTTNDFRYGESARVPPSVSLPNRNYMNLLEAPVLFYVVGFVYYLNNATLTWFVPLAWVFVGLRVIHSLIHLTYNKVSHRLAAFAGSNVVLVMLWTMVLRTLLAGA
jgi:hypothetical protein